MPEILTKPEAMLDFLFWVISVAPGALAIFSVVLLALLAVAAVIWGFGMLAGGFWLWLTRPADPNENAANAR